MNLTVVFIKKVIVKKEKEKRQHSIFVHSSGRKTPYEQAAGTVMDIIIITRNHFIYMQIQY